MKSRIWSVHLLFLIFNNSFAWDGCPFPSWRCGTLCVDRETECDCGGTQFNLYDQMWCCPETESSCTGKGRTRLGSPNGRPDPLKRTYFLAERNNEGKLIGAQCAGVALNLTQPCKNRTCNYFEKDESRNVQNILRSHVPCKSSNSEIKECIQEFKERDNMFNCRNRADEEPFEKNFGNSTSLLINTEKILVPCNTTNHRGETEPGFECSQFTDDDGNHCLPQGDWCSTNDAYSCNELVGRTATGKTTDPLLCRNQSFWENKRCSNDDEYNLRCTGDTPGQCDTGNGCVDKSSRIKMAQGGGCFFS